MDEFTAPGMTVRGDPPHVELLGDQEELQGATGAQILGSIEASSIAVQAKIDTISLGVGLLRADLCMVVERFPDTKQHLSKLKKEVSALKTVLSELLAKTVALKRRAEDAERRSRARVGHPEASDEGGVLIWIGGAMRRLELELTEIEASVKHCLLGGLVPAKQGAAVKHKFAKLRLVPAKLRHAIHRMCPNPPALDRWPAVLHKWGVMENHWLRLVCTDKNTERDLEPWGGMLEDLAAEEPRLSVPFEHLPVAGLLVPFGTL
ncbi:hypothetical protein NDU88_002871 [Pleurodeles waltl]|uniref:Uncharacterized protein n=1 Tax=Pleurodeles waltl TaxID=8319 RepID=A0AAV7RGL2_PLEWA|nr:hypothetical protein NDU88_002871 [Pleurodeles waltl]